MLPVIALVGRPNVGKSTLFNCLTQTRNALVADFPGLTRDRQYGFGKVGRVPYVVTDTGGLGDGGDGLEKMVAAQAMQAAAEADAVLFLVDARAGPSTVDHEIAQQLRRLGKPLYLVINKAEHLHPDLVSSEFFTLGLGQPQVISAAHKRGVQSLMDTVLSALDVAQTDGLKQESASRDIRLAIVGRPNVGKSTLVNRLLGEQRVLAYDEPGTTRDSVSIAFEKDGQAYTLIDTAGVRRRSRVTDAIEKFSIVKTLQSIQQCNVVLMMLDARQGIADQDAHLLGLILDSGRALVIAVNKWDRLDREIRTQVRNDLERRLNFIDFADVHFISALQGSGISEVLRSVQQAYRSAMAKFATAHLTRILQDALSEHQPPLVQGHSIKLRYAHQGGQNPPIIVIHGNRVQHVPSTYRRYLANTYRAALKLRGTPLAIELKSSDNPYLPAQGKKKRRAKSRTR